MKLDTSLTAKMEPFDSFWEAPNNIEKGYSSFSKFYRRNYLKHLPTNRDANVLVSSCGPGYFVKLLTDLGYRKVLGIDSDSTKVEYAQKKGLNCKLENAFPFLRENDKAYDVIIAEQEINHLTKEEIIEFLQLCRGRLNNNGILVVHSLNGANPITGSEALAQNYDHYNTFTEYSLRQILEHSGFQQIKIIPLNLYVFYENPFNYVGLLLNGILNVIFRISFIFYGKSNSIFTKKIGAISMK